MTSEKKETSKRIMFGFSSMLRSCPAVEDAKEVCPVAEIPPEIILNAYVHSVAFLFSTASTAQEKVLLLPVELHQSHDDKRQHFGCEE